MGVRSTNLRGNLRMDTCIFHEEENQCWIHFQTEQEFQAATDVLNALEVEWNRDPDEESRNIRVGRSTKLTQAILSQWMRVPRASRLWEQLGGE